MPHNDTFTSGAQDLYFLSGQFTSTVKTSLPTDSSFGESDPNAIGWNGANPDFAGGDNDKLYLVSGVFSTTLKDSESVTGVTFALEGISLDRINTPWSAAAAGDRKLFLQSGQFTSTLKTSQDIFGLTGTNPFDISYDDTNTPWAGSNDKLYLQSGQFTSTIKDSEDVSGVDNGLSGITYDGTNTPWCGLEAVKLYLQSGQFTSTIKTSLASGGVFAARGIETEAIQVAVHVAGTIITASPDESDVVAGGLTIILTMETGRLDPQSDTWHADIGGNNSRTQDLINGLTSSGAEANGWNAVVKPGLDFNDVVRDSATQVTITLPAFASYDITIDEAITATIPATALTGGNGPIDAEPVIVIAAQVAGVNNDTVWCGATDEKLYLQSGQFTSTIKDSEDVSAVDTPGSAASDATNAPWLGNVTDKAYVQSGQFTSTIKTSLDFTAVDSDMQGISWSNPDTPMMGNSANKMFLMSGQFTLTVKDSEDVSAIDFTPRGISWDGADTPWQGQFNLTTFGDKLYLQSGQFTSTLKTSQDVNAVESAANDISYSNTTGDTPWIGAADDKLYLTSGQFSSTLHDSEDVSAIEASPTGIDVNDRLAAGGPVTVTLIGTVTNPTTEQNIRTGGKTILLVVSGDTWGATVGADNPTTQALIDGITSAQSEVQGWNAVVRAGLNAANVTRTSATVVTITLPAFSTYDISEDETVTVTVPASALTTSVDPVVASPSFSITFIPLPPVSPRRIMDAAQVREYITLVTPDGTRYPMNTPHQFGRWVISDSGKGTPPIDYITQRGPFQHGATVRDFFLAPRVIQLLIRQEFCDRLDWWDGRGALLDAIRPNRQTIATAAEPFQLEWCLPTGERRQINCFITEGPRFEPRQLARWDEWAFQEVLRFICYDPLFFDPTRVDSAFSIALAAHLIFPITFPIQFGSGTISDTLNITYEGTWETYPTIVITGPLEDPIIRNVTTGEKLEFDVDIGVGRTVTIDLAYGAKTVVDDLGNNLIGNLSADSDLATFHIAPAQEAPNGVNVLTLTGTNPTGATSVTIRYFTRYFGI